MLVGVGVYDIEDALASVVPSTVLCVLHANVRIDQRDLLRETFRVMPGVARALDCEEKL